MRTIVRRYALSRWLRVAVAFVALACFTSSANADVGSKIIERCERAESIAGFSPQEYHKALQELPTEEEEYSDCGELIHKAQLAAASGTSASNPVAEAASSRVAIPTTPEEQRAIAKVHHSGAAPVKEGAGIIKPGVVHANIASVVNSLPTPLLAVLALLLVCGLAVGGGALRNHLSRADSDD